MYRLPCCGDNTNIHEVSIITYLAFKQACFIIFSCKPLKILNLATDWLNTYENIEYFHVYHSIFFLYFRTQISFMLDCFKFWILNLWRSSLSPSTSTLSICYLQVQRQNRFEHQFLGNNSKSGLLFVCTASFWLLIVIWLATVGNILNI